MYHAYIREQKNASSNGFSKVFFKNLELQDSWNFARGTCIKIIF